MRKTILFAILLIFLGLCLGKTLNDIRPHEDLGYRKATASIVPVTDYEVHTVGQLYLTISNFGIFGSSRGDGDPQRCSPFLMTEDMEVCDIEPGSCIPSGEFPGCTGVEYLFQGCFWIGAVVDGDTLVSVGHDGWFHNQEMFPARMESDTIKKNSTNIDTTTAVSEQDFYCEYTDSSTDESFVNENHRPIGIKIRQESYSWSYDYAKNFVILKFLIENIRKDARTLEDVYFGIYLDGDCGHVDVPNYAQDDITGFIEEYTYFIEGRDSTIDINLAWIADNDGDADPEDRRFDEQSATSAMAVKVLYPRSSGGAGEELDYSFNWWVSNTNEELDWGPTRIENETGWDGTPETDKHKYQVLANGEFDYDQTEINDYDGDPEWNPLPGTADDLADGYDTRFLLSFGPFDLEADTTGDSLIIAFMVGEDFHIDPSNFCSERGSAGECTGDWSPESFRYDNLASAARWVQLVYDNGYEGPQPPPTPDFHVDINPYDVLVYWDDRAEDAVDPITELEDFEGYNIYIADWNLERYYTPIAKFDSINYYRYAKFEYDPIRDVYIPFYSDQISPVDTPYTVPIEDQEDNFLRDTTFDSYIPMGQNVGFPPETLINGETYYYHHIRNLRPGADRYVVVTATDNGRPSEGLEGIETNKKNNAKWIVPQGYNDKIEGVYVWPNPYRVDEDYTGKEGFWAEGSPTSRWTEYSRELHFVNLPANCVIRIFTLDGDLVDQLKHHDDEVGTIQGGETWDMINRNDQSIVSGIYVYSVEDLDTGDIEVGKFVIIK